MKKKYAYDVEGKRVEWEYNYIPVRYILAVLITILEVLAIIGIVGALCYYVPYFYLAAWATEIFCVINIIASDDNPEYKIPWLLFVLILPIAGFMLYFLFYSRMLSKKYVRRLKKLYGEKYPEKDEENLSAGMRSGVILLDQLKKQYGLTYKMMINSEPHQRKKKEEGIFSFGSIGKMMPWVYVRGSLAHAGKVFEGLNPTNVMCEIVRRTEVNMDLSDVVGGEAAPPPTWLYLRENKLGYDVSMPLTITGCLSVLTLNQSPQTVMQKLRDICGEAFKTVIGDMNRNYKRFRKATGQPDKELPWKANVVDFGQLYEEAKSNYGDAFVQAYEREMAQLSEKVRCGQETLITANFHLVDFVYDYIKDLSPRVVLGLCPPDYPGVANILRPDGAGQRLRELLHTYVREQFGQTYTGEHFYTGISDLSYSGIENAQETADRLKESMPFFGGIYTLPLEEIRNISMPCVNIGPWGKDFHKLTERVYKVDLYERTPKIQDYAIRQILQ